MQIFKDLLTNVFKIWIFVVTLYRFWNIVLYE